CGPTTLCPVFAEGRAGGAAEHAVSLSVRDSAALLDATCGTGAGDPYVAPPPARPFHQEAGAEPGALRVGCASLAPNGVKIDAECLRALGETVRLCADLGHRVQEVDPPIDRAAVVATFLTLAAANTVVNLASHPTKGRTARPDEVE